MTGSAAASLLPTVAAHPILSRCVQRRPAPFRPAPLIDPETRRNPNNKERYAVFEASLCQGLGDVLEGAAAFSTLVRVTASVGARP